VFAFGMSHLRCAGDNDQYTIDVCSDNCDADNYDLCRDGDINSCGDASGAQQRVYAFMGMFRDSIVNIRDFH
jgi:hypothetical protein